MSQVERFGKYILLEKVASGGMAEIYLAKAPGAGGINKFIAIKRILPQYSDSPEFIEMFKDEAKIAINLAHSNIVSIYEFGIEKGQFFLVMDYVEGKNLRQVLNRMKQTKQTLQLDQILYVAREVAAGLDSAHRCLDGTTGRPLNITHRDMSPQNVMISYEGEVKVVDFGIAKAESKIETTKAGTLKGKFGYMSPEQAEGISVDLRTDIFSLGTVVWELIANDRLFVANNEINTLRKIRYCQIPSLRKINPKIPEELEKIINKALTRDRNLRYQTSAAFHRDLNTFLNRHYPSFSPQDFSVSIRTLFADEILESRRRLVEYAKINIQDVSSADDFTVTQTSTESSPRRSSGLETLGSGNNDFGRTPAPIKSDNIGGSFNRFLEENQGEIFKNNIGTETKAAAESPREKFGQSSTRRKPRISSGSYDLPDLRKNTHKKLAAAPTGTPAKIATMILVGFIASVLVLKKPFAPDDAANFVKVNVIGGVKDLLSKKNDPIEKPVPVEDIQNVVHVFTDPPGATVYIDGKKGCQPTPCKARMEPDIKHKILIQKERYLSRYIDYLSSEKADKLNITLEGDRVGYLNIEVFPNLGKTQIFINDKEILETPPIAQYAVPSGQQVKIRAYHPGANKSAEQTVVPKKNSQLDIKLFLR